MDFSTQTSRRARRAVEVFDIPDVKGSSNIVHALMAESELKETDQSLPYVPLCDIKPEPMSHEATMPSQYGRV